MSNFVTSKDESTIKTVYILPSQAEWSDIPQLKAHNRGQNEAKQNLDDLMKSVKARQAFVTPLKGYIDGGTIRITAGSRRLAVGKALEAEGEEIKLPVILIKKPKGEEDIIDALLDGDVDNNQRNADSDVVRHSTYSILRDMGLTLHQIGERTGVSHTLVANTLKAFRVEPLRAAIEAGKLSVRAASEFLNEKYQKVDSNNKPLTTVVEEDGKKYRKPVYDEEKIKKDLTQAGELASEAGRGGRIGATTAQAGQREQPELLSGMRVVKACLDEPEDNVPTAYRLLFRFLNGDLSRDGLKKAINQNKLQDELGWLLEIELNIKKRALAKEKASEAKGKGKAKAKDDIEAEAVEEDYE